MPFKTTLLAGLMAAASALPALASDIMVMDAYARAAAPSAMTGAAFLVIRNTGAQGDRLIGVASSAAERVELHRHVEDADGVMKMIHVEAGFDLPAGGLIEMKRGGDHVMLMGLVEPFEHGDLIPLTLIFETTGEIEMTVPVDLERQPGEGHETGHGQGSD